MTFHHPSTLTLEDMQRLAGRHDGRCLSTDYRNVETRLRWQCADGHEWEMTPASVKLGRWCPVCKRAGAMYRQLDEMRELARSRGGRCLADRYRGTKGKLEWQCERGHIWKSAPSCVKLSGSWCPVCAVENKRGSLAAIRELAATRGGRCFSTEFLSVNHKVRWQCDQGHVWEAPASRIRLGSWCPACAHDSLRGTLQEMHELAHSRGGRCLSSEYRNLRTRLRWQCAEGHEWMATPGHVKTKTWCPFCRHQSFPHTIETMQDIAKKRGGECLSKTYVNNATKLEWRCHRGHEWAASWGSMQSGSWCPSCARLGLTRDPHKRKRYDVDG